MVRSCTRSKPPSATCWQTATPRWLSTPPATATPAPICGRPPTPTLTSTTTTPSRSGKSEQPTTMTAADREYTANTVDETVWVRVAGSGQILGVQLEPAVMERRGHEIAERIQACHDVAYFQGQLVLRAEFERRGAPADAISWMATRQDLERARARLEKL